jgi:hypothetical protein
VGTPNIHSLYCNATTIISQQICNATHSLPKVDPPTMFVTSRTIQLAHSVHKLVFHCENGLPGPMVAVITVNKSRDSYRIGPRLWHLWWKLLFDITIKACPISIVIEHSVINIRCHLITCKSSSVKVLLHVQNDMVHQHLQMAHTACGFA